MGRSDDYHRGFREANRLAVNHLHAVADEMNDPGARHFYNMAAFEVGSYLRNFREARAAREAAFASRVERGDDQ